MVIVDGKVEHPLLREYELHHMVPGITMRKTAISASPFQSIQMGKGILWWQCDSRILSFIELTKIGISLPTVLASVQVQPTRVL